MNIPILLIGLAATAFACAACIGFPSPGCPSHHDNRLGNWLVTVGLLLLTLALGAWMASRP